jgi:hypothetical protein
MWLGIVTLGLAATIATILHDRFSSPQTKASSPAKTRFSTALGPPLRKVNNTQDWGPKRKTFKMRQPAPYPVFNSITDNPTEGDERNFVQCKDKEDPNREFRDTVLANDGHTYVCLIFFDNDVAPNLDSIASPNVGGNVAAKLQNARVKVQRPLSAIYNPGVVGLLSADNTFTVWDSCNFIAPRRVKFSYVRGSAHLHVHDTPEGGVPMKEVYRGSTMTAGILSPAGALLGDKQDGYLGQHAGFVLLEFRVTLEGE